MKGDNTISIDIHKNLVRKYQTMSKTKQNRINKLIIIIEEKNVSIKLMNDFINTLIEKKIITKEDVKDAIKNKKYSKEVVKKNRKKYQ